MIPDFIIFVMVYANTNTNLFGNFDMLLYLELGNDKISMSYALAFLRKSSS